jgi:hypothetical protein
MLAFVVSAHLNEICRFAGVGFSRQISKIYRLPYKFPPEKFFIYFPYLKYCNYSRFHIFYLRLAQLIDTFQTVVNLVV